MEDKLRWTFRLYDINKDGVLSRTEIRWVGEEEGSTDTEMEGVSFKRSSNYPVILQWMYVKDTAQNMLPLVVTV